MNLKSLFIVLALALFTSHGAYASGAKNSATMSWINNPPADDAKYFYAVGYGDTQRDAKSDALSTISAKISVNVSSNFSSSVTATRQGGDEEVLAQTKSDVVSKSKDIQYTDVKVLESTQDKGQWVLLVKVDRAILTATYERKLDQVDTKLKTEWKFFEQAGVFEKLKLSVDIDELLKQTDSFFPLLHALNPSYNDSKYTTRYTEYTRVMRQARNELVFKIVSDKNSEPLASLIKSKLSAKNATFNASKYNVLIEITTKAKKRKYKSTNAKFANLTFALRKTTIKATDKNGNVVSSVVYKTKEGSSEGFEDALARTAKYEKKIKELGIIKFITGN